MGRWAGNAILPGSGEAASSMKAFAKNDVLKEIQQIYFHDVSTYSGGDIPLNDALKAIKYARSKKLTKAKRKAVIGTVKAAGFVIGAATGATLGSIVPVAGTAVGGIVGGAGVATAVGGATTVLDQLKRKTKGLYKAIRGTRGEHRLQAAQALLYCQSCLPGRDPKQNAAEEALAVLLDEEYDEVMAMTSEAMTARVADRLKSN